ncbi:MAG: serine/threonine-protein kinase [Myxococcota bacterium]
MGEHFGNYEILKRIAVGGMAEVYLAKHTGLGGFERLVCIKRILPHLGQQEDFISMFQDEARIAANFIHPNIAQIYDIGHVDGAYYIAMEYVRGEDLRRVYNAEVARGRAMPLEQAAQIVMYAAAGLDYAHRQTTIDGRPLGIVHRDISPQNIIITYDGHAKIVDFGVAKAAIKVSETRSGVLKGKYSYMSPEQASGDPIDGRTDIFAMGITLYEVTTGTRLFKRENELETLHAVIEGEVKAPSEVIPNYDPELEKIVLKALTYDPDERYATAGELERELERFLLDKNHPTSPSSLGTYMQDLFAEKLADELLFGGQPWEESNTPSRHRKTSLREKPQAKEHADPLAPELTKITQSPSPSLEDSTQVEDAWESGSEPRTSNWEPSDTRDGWAAVSHPNEQTATHIGVPLSESQDQPKVADTDHGAKAQVHTAAQSPTPTKVRRSSGFLWGSIAAIVLAFSGAAAVFWTAHHEDRVSFTGPLTIDSEPRGARVELIGAGVKSINKKYAGYRTPFSVVEGIPADTSLKVRIIKDGFPIKDLDVPPTPTGVVPQPLFAELQAQVPLQDGTLFFLSTPEGATVSVDDEKLPGQTPLKEIRLKGGQIHRFEFRLAGFHSHQESLFVESGARRVVSVELAPLKKPNAKIPAAKGDTVVTTNSADPDAAPQAPQQDSQKEDSSDEAGNGPEDTPSSRAFLSLTSAMPMKVTIGRFVGTTPVRKLALSPGVHRVRLESKAEGFVLYRKVRLQAGRSENLNVTPAKGKLAVNAVPWAFAKIGNQKANQTPFSVQLHEGEYDVVFECPDGRQKKNALVYYRDRQPL